MQTLKLRESFEKHGGKPGYLDWIVGDLGGSWKTAQVRAPRSLHSAVTHLHCQAVAAHNLEYHDQHSAACSHVTNRHYNVVTRVCFVYKVFGKSIERIRSDGVAIIGLVKVPNLCRYDGLAIRIIVSVITQR